MVDSKRNTGAFLGVFFVLLCCYESIIAVELHILHGVIMQRTVFLKVNPPKNKVFSNQNKGHLGSRYTFIRNQLKFKLSLRGQFAIVRSPYYKGMIVYGVFPKNRGKTPQIMNFNRVGTIIFTIHFGGPSLFLG